MIAKYYKYVLCVCAFILISDSYAFAQLNENCTVNVLNRSTQSRPDGTWIVSNIPANFGQVRFRATCIEDGQTLSGESDLVSIPSNGSLDIPPIVLGNTSPIPDSLSISSPNTELMTVGETVQLVVNATFPDTTQENVTASAAGTSYTSSNPNIVSIDSEGVVTANSGGLVIISALNEGALGLIQLSVDLGIPDTDGDGITDDIEIANGLDPNNPADGIEDTDGDGLTNKEELVDFGTNFQVADTDGDGINDGEELVAGADGFITNPLIADTDGDGLLDGDEVSIGSDPLDTDTDNDGLTDGIEVTLSLNPTLVDTDGDGTDDGLEDTDGDGLGNIEEIVVYGTDPSNADTDGDLFTDGFEVFNGFDPLDPTDHGYTSAVAADSPIAYWKLDELSRNFPTDDLVANNNGVYIGSFINGILDSVDGRSARFNGTNTWIKVDSIPGRYSTGDDFTFEGWFKTDHNPVNNTDDIIFSTNTSGGDNILRIGVGTNGSIFVSSGFQGVGDQAHGSGYNDARWHHLVVTIRGVDGLTTTYVDGVVVQGFETLSNVTPWNSGARTSIGQEFDGSSLSDFFDGQLDEIALYKSILTQQQVQSHYDIGMGQLDEDNDGLSFDEENGLGTDPLNPDTDSDGIPDGVEVQNGTDPLVADTGLNYDQIVINNNPLAYYKLDENSGTTAADSSGNNNGVYTNGVRLNQTPSLLDSSVSSARFDGVNDYIQANSLAGQLRTGDDFTLQAWFNTTDTPSIVVDNLILGVNSASTSSNVNIAFIGVGTNGGIYVSGPGEQGSGFNDGRWHQLTLTQDGFSGLLRIYVDGVEIGNGFSRSPFNWNNAGRFSIGQEFDGSTLGNFFYGNLDEISIYRTKLTASQIQTIYDIGKVELDVDEDGLSAAEEQILGTDPNNPDTDADGITDGNEVTNGTDPTLTNTGVAYFESIIGSNAIAYWHLDEDTGTVAADSIGTNNGTYLNGVELDKNPAVLDSSISSVRLDGVNDYININSFDGELNTGDNFSFEAWFNTTNIPPDNADLILGVNNPSSSTNVNIMLIGIGLNGGINVTGVGEQGSGFNDGQWHHLVVTENGGDRVLRIYVDGIQIGSGFTTAGTDWNAAGRYSIGQEFDGNTTGNFFRGFLDEISIYRRELTSQQVQTHYNLGFDELDDDEDGLSTAEELALGTNNLDPDTDGDGLTDGYEVDNSTDPLVANSGVSYLDSILSSNPVAYLQLDELSGTTAADSSTNNNNGVYQGNVLLNQAPAIVNGSQASVDLNGSNAWIQVNSLNREWTNRNNFTIETWFNTTDIPPNNASNLIFGVNNSGSANINVMLLGTGVNGGIYLNGPVLGSNFNDGQWHHLVVSQNGVAGLTNVFVDGQFIGNVNISPFNWNAAGRFSIGQEFDGSTQGNYFNGLLDEVVFYRKVLTADQVLSHYEIGAGLAP